MTASPVLRSVLNDGLPLDTAPLVDTCITKSSRRCLSRDRASRNAARDTVKETARLLRLSRSAAYRRIEAGQIEAFKLGERWFVPTAPLKRKLGLP